MEGGSSANGEGSNGIVFAGLTTEMLSRQFRHIWSETKTLEFNEDLFVRHDDPRETQQAQRGAFVGFIHEVMGDYPQETEVRKFSLKISGPRDHAADINQFIHFAVSRGVKHLELDFSDPTWDRNSVVDPEQGFPLPQQVYQHGSLESLHLYWCKLDVSRLTTLQSLKTLSLGWMAVTMDQIKDLVVSCPILDTLRLKQCQGMAALQISIPNSTLKSLVMDNCRLNSDFVLLEGPKLRMFDYSGQVAQFVLENQRELVEACLDFGCQDEFDESGTLLCELLEQLFAVRVMTVCSIFLQLVPTGDEPLHTNANLNVEHLTMNTALHANEFIGIKFMLASCPRISTLTLRLAPGKIFQDYEAPYPINPQSFWSQTVSVETCLRQSLQVLNVSDFRGTPNEMKLIKYIMNFGRCLRRINLYFPSMKGNGGGDGSFMAIAERASFLLDAPRASRELKIWICKSD